MVINALESVIPELIGGSADLTPSNKTRGKNMTDYQSATRIGQYLRFGIREHGMVAISNGIFAHGGLMPYCATFLVFTGYAMGSIRLSALSEFGMIFVMTHDSIGLGEDGPTHQPVETLATLRSVPRMLVVRPCDGNETSGAWAVAVENRERPTTMALSRQGLPNLPGTSIDGVFKGGYVVQKEAEGGAPDIVLVATGSEVPLCIEAAKLLDGLRVRVVSLPCWELFEEQSLEYRRTTLAVDSNAPVLAVEAASTQGWGRYSHSMVGMTSFGASGPGAKVMAHFGFTPENVSAKAKQLVAYYKGRGQTPPALFSNPLLDA